MPHLTQNQQKVADKIIYIGHSLGKNETQIRTAIWVAFLESSLGAEAGKNPRSSALGLYQYTKGAWTRHVGDKSNEIDAIRAFYKDMQTFDNEYAQYHVQNSERFALDGKPNPEMIPTDVSRNEFIYIKHHDGPNAKGDKYYKRHDNSARGITIYDTKQQAAMAVTDEAMKNYTPAGTSAPLPNAAKKQASVLDYYATGGLVHVSAYERATSSVHDHERSRPDGILENNLSYSPPFGGRGKKEGGQR